MAFVLDLYFYHDCNLFETYDPAVVEGVLTLVKLPSAELLTEKVQPPFEDKIALALSMKLILSYC